MNPDTWLKYKIVVSKYPWLAWLLVALVVCIYAALITWNVWLSVQIAKQSGHTSYGWAYFMISGYLTNISSNTRKTV